MEAFHHFNHNMTFFTLGFLVFHIVFFIALCYLEMRLSKAEDWWKGLILPAIALLLSSSGKALVVVLLVIYGVNRYKIKKNKDEIEQMKIQDL